MQVRCSAELCGESPVTSLEERALCYQHFLNYAYGRLESISSEMGDRQFLQRHSESIGRFLEDCISSAADVACVFTAPSNLERARVLDVLLWASEIHSLLRRGQRVPAQIAVTLRSEISGQEWEEKSETQLLSLHGAQIVCRHQMKTGDVLTCVRLDNGARVAARVVWTRPRASGEIDAGIEFLSQVNFWNLGKPDGTESMPAAPATPTAN